MKAETPQTVSELDRRLALAVEQARDHFKGADNGTTTQIVEIEVGEITSIRRKVGLTQAAFAKRIGISVATLRNWEQGRRSPSGPARKLLDILNRRPGVALELAGGD